jgi:tetratricopeptide (TPR) repeat protein
MPTAEESIAQGKQARSAGQLDAARAYYAQAAEIYNREDNRLAYAHTIRHIADMYLTEARQSEAKPLYEAALEIYRGNLDTKLLDLANTVRPFALLNEDTGLVPHPCALFLAHGWDSYNQSDPAFTSALNFSSGSAVTVLPFPFIVVAYSSEL